MILPKPTNHPPIPESKPPKEHGVWEWIYADIYRCTKCNKYTSVDEDKHKQPLYKFCPYCKSKMLSEREANDIARLHNDNRTSMGMRFA